LRKKKNRYLKKKRGKDERDDLLFETGRNDYGTLVDSLLTAKCRRSRVARVAEKVSKRRITSSGKGWGRAASGKRGRERKTKSSLIQSYSQKGRH